MATKTLLFEGSNPTTGIEWFRTTYGGHGVSNLVVGDAIIMDEGEADIILVDRADCFSEIIAETQAGWDEPTIGRIGGYTPQVTKEAPAVFTPPEI